ncbi:hypothetical protein GCM10010245_71790 [Streptomyces spectabilis]|uniref:Uncharacterized protein n=1 Tax=Streptomyces spectabilis TaxID=68270 RepID=A0A5P2X2C1_STRST|nr:hypothetical protein CP982_07470 [Streptomyces spectabilis]GGV45827.1 hypothetical protein GCM10010245_71790 [Streptomyces spectabilis]
MHNHPTGLDDYDWPACVAPRCGRLLWVAETGRLACRPCEDATATRIRELPALFARLDTTAMLMKGARRTGSATSGSRTPPIPPRLDVLALVGPGGIAARLRDIEDAWRSALGWTVAPWRGSPAEAIPQHVRFLADNLLWACSSYDSIGQDIDDLRKLHGECKAIADGEKRGGCVQVGPCPTRYDDDTLCGEPLTAVTDNHRIHCRACGARWETLGEWRGLRDAQEAVLEEQLRRAEDAA